MIKIKSLYDRFRQLVSSKIRVIVFGRCSRVKKILSQKRILEHLQVDQKNNC